MSREIKFRVWDNKLKRYWFKSDDYTNVDKIGYYGDYYRSLVEDFFNSFFDVQEFDRFVLEQYTGLKDKDGKEIYEGDIIQLKGSPYVYCIEWFDYYWSINDYGKLGYQDYEPQPLNHCVYESSKVIGNINENPELLNEKTI